MSIHWQSIVGVRYLFLHKFWSHIINYEEIFMKAISTNKAPAAIGPYSQGYIHGGFFYGSGQIPVDPASGEVVKGGIAEQTSRACENVGALLEAAGIGFDKVIKTTCFISDMGDFGEFNAVYEKYFISKPARSCVAVKTLPKNVLCEVEVTAYAGDK